MTPADGVLIGFGVAAVVAIVARIVEEMRSRHAIQVLREGIERIDRAHERRQQADALIDELHRGMERRNSDLIRDLEKLG